MTTTISSFISSISIGVAPMIVIFTNTSSGAFTSCLWDFGDGNTSTEINPTHQFTLEGVFNVSLTVYTADGDNFVSSNPITTLTSGSENSGEVAVQYGLFTSKRFDVGQVAVLKETLSGSSFSTEYPLISSSDESTDARELYLDSSSIISNSQVIVEYAVGLDQILFDSDIDALTDPFNIDWNMFMGVIISEEANATPDVWSNVFSGGTNGSQMLMYNILAVDTTGSTITVDRPLPYRGVSDTGYITAIVFVTDSGSTSLYNGDSSNSVHGRQSVDSFGVLDIGGISNIGNAGSGSLLYFGYDLENGQTITSYALTDSGSSASDAFYPGSIVLSLPHIMVDGKSTIGITLQDEYGDTLRDEINGLRYRYLRDGVDSSSNIYGRVYYDKKVAVVDDLEINAALQFSSNRNYTLPQCNISSVSVGSGYATSDTAYYVTYAVKDYITSADAGDGYGLGNLEPLHCRVVERFVPPSAGSDILVEIPTSTWFTTDPTSGTGFTVDDVMVLVGTGDTDSTVAEIGSWEAFTYSTQYESMSSGVTIDGTGGASYDMSSLNLSGTSNLSFGTENLGIAYMSGYVETNIYKMSATCVAKNNEFNESQNITFDKETHASTYITEVALYNETNDLLMVGKLNKPIEKNDQKYVVVKMEIDL